MERFSRRGTWVDALALLVIAASLGAYLFAEHRLGLRYPVPWADEGSFLWPALSFRDRWTLFAPELDPARALLWMPPGFMVFEGLVFKVVPFSLGAARALSALAVCGAFACVAAMLPRSSVRLGHAIVLATFLFFPIFELVGNVARMEGLVLLLAALGFLLLERGYISGLGVLGLLPLVHPNGVFAGAAGLAYFLASARGRRPICRRDVVVLVAVVVAWVAYAIYVASNFDAFMIDMNDQIRFKRFVSAGDGGAWGRARHAVVWGPALALVVAWACSHRFRVKVGALAALAAALFVQTVVATGWLYEVYAAFAVLLTSLVVLEVASAVVARWVTIRRGVVLGFACATVALVAVLIVGPAPFMTHSFERATVANPTRAPTYSTPADHAVVAPALVSLANDAHPVTVQFVPSGEGLLFETERSAGLRYAQPSFRRSRADAVLLHESASLPAYVHDLELYGALIPNESLGTPIRRVLRSRDGSEHWVLYTWPSAPGSG